MSGTTPRSTVVVGLCTYNRGGKIVPTLEAMAKLDRAGGRVTEAVIVDNRSTDDTANVIDAFIERNTGLPMRRVHEATPGKSAAMARLFHETSEPLIAMLDDDTLPDVGWARGMLSLFDDEPKAGAVGGPVHIVWQDGMTRIAQIYKRSLGDQLLGEKRVRLDDPASFLMGASLGVRREAWAQSGWLERRTLEGRRGELLECGEDAELCIRIRQAGWELWYEPTAKLGHVIPGSRTTTAYIAKLRESICKSEPMIKWMTTPGVDGAWARAQYARARRLWLKTLLFDWRPTRRRVRLAERKGRVEGWKMLLQTEAREVSQFESAGGG